MILYVSFSAPIRPLPGVVSAERRKLSAGVSLERLNSERAETEEVL